jgi:hypothetical protein
MNLTGSIALTYRINETLAYGLASESVQSEVLPSFALAAGTGSDQADLHWSKSGVQLTATGTTTYTLSALADDLGRTVALAKVKALLIYPTTRSAGDKLIVGAAASHPWNGPWGTGAKEVKALYLDVADLTDNWAVSSGSSDQLQITASGSNAITFDIAVVGTSA